MKAANRSLRAGAAEQDSRQNNSAEIQRLAAENQELDRLRKDQDELAQLREEIADLQVLLPIIDRIRIENQDLSARLARRRDSETSEEFFARVGGMDDMKEKAFRIKCVNNLKNLGLAARIWGSVHGDAVPSTFLEMKAELATPKLLLCPSDTARTAAEDRTQFAPNQSSYEFLSPGAAEFDPQEVLFRCPIHNNVTLGDGSVQQLGSNVQVVFKGGKWITERKNEILN
ncbi:MAG: hypothetical protein O2960_08965 [Verrucomicrobia bacterium]|nr:hypothetical protein [Verrucomicrobiota bacterium]